MTTTYPTVRTDDFVRDLNDYRDWEFYADGIDPKPLAHGMVIELDDHVWYVVVCRFCGAAYGANADNGYAGSAADFCENCGKMFAGKD